MRHVYIKNKKNDIQVLPFYGKAITGETVGIDSQCMRKNGKPWLPICGEFQYSRFSECDWEKELRKMKAAGIEIVTSYIFWIHHEEERGIYRFDGCRDIRKFANLCSDLGLSLVLRLGPWVTGECRNGGFPDWAIELPDVFGKVHGDTPEFMGCIRAYFEQLYEQVSECMWEDGGSIIGIQMENEYTPHRAHTIENGFQYLHKLKEMLQEIGFHVPYYYYTAWNRALFVNQEALPMFGAYCDEPWSPSLGELDPLTRFLIIEEREFDIYGDGVEANRMDSDDMTDIDVIDAMLKKNYSQLLPTPYLTAELGGGMQPSEHRRIVCEQDDTEALSVCMLGRGANMLGYYIFHGGTHPNGKLTTTNSIEREGVMSNTYPKKSYDFSAPIGENTMLRHSYHALRRRHLMVKELEEILAMSIAYFPEDNAIHSTDIDSLRYSVRYDEKTGAGFVFFNNHVRKRTMPQRYENITVHIDENALELPAIRLMNHEMKIIPFQLPLGEAVLLSTNAEFLTRIGDRFYFYTDEKPIYNLKGEAKITTLTAKEALYAWQFKDKLYISEDMLYEKNGEVCIESRQAKGKYSYYDSEGIKHDKVYEVERFEQDVHITQTQMQEGCKAIYEIEFNYNSIEKLEDVLMSVDYIGDRVEVYNEDELIGDYFTNGEIYSITLSRFNYPKKLRIEIYHSVNREERYFELPVAYGCSLTDVKLESIYKVK